MNSLLNTIGDPTAGVEGAVPIKRGRGRPLGSRSKPKDGVSSEPGVTLTDRQCAEIIELRDRLCESALAAQAAARVAVEASVALGRSLRQFKRAPGSEAAAPSVPEDHPAAFPPSNATHSTITEQQGGKRHE